MIIDQCTFVSPLIEDADGDCTCSNGIQTTITNKPLLVTVLTRKIDSVQNRNIVTKIVLINLISFFPSFAWIFKCQTFCCGTCEITVC